MAAEIDAFLEWFGVELKGNPHPIPVNQPLQIPRNGNPLPVPILSPETVDHLKGYLASLVPWLWPGSSVIFPGTLDPGGLGD